MSKAMNSPVQRADAGSAADFSSLRVMIVDDEPTVRMLVIDVLHDQGYAAVEAKDGPEALRILQSDARIDLLITEHFYRLKP